MLSSYSLIIFPCRSQGVAFEAFGDQFAFREMVQFCSVSNLQNEKLKHDIRGTTYTVLVMFASNVMNLVVNRKDLSKVSAELCKHIKNQKWKNILTYACFYVTNKCKIHLR